MLQVARHTGAARRRRFATLFGGPRLVARLRALRVLRAFFRPLCCDVPMKPIPIPFPIPVPAPRVRRRLAVGWLLAAAGHTAAVAGDSPPPSGVVTLMSSASAEVSKDLMSVTLSNTRDGADAAAVQSALKQALDAALAEARKAARPQQLEVQTGNFSLFPRYNKAAITGWQGTAELVIEGRDMPAISALVGRITTLSVARVAFGLSREQRERVEGDVTAQAVARWRARAADIAKQFGYAGYSVREVSVGSTDAPVIQPMAVMRSQAMRAQADESLPVEAGKAQVSVTVSGAAQLLK